MNNASAVLAVFDLWDIPGRKSPFFIRRKHTRVGARSFPTEAARLAFAEAELNKSDQDREYELVRDRLQRWQVSARDVANHWVQHGLVGYNLRVGATYEMWNENQLSLGAAGDITLAGAKAMGRSVGYFAAAFYERRMPLVAVSEFTKWVDDFGRAHGPGERNMVISWVHAFYAAYADKLQKYNPAPLRLLTVTQSRPQPLPVATIYKLLQIALTDPRFSKHAKRIVCVLCLGMRNAQACRLRDADIFRDGPNSGIKFWLENNRKAGKPRQMHPIPDMFWSFFDAAPGELGEKNLSTTTFQRVLGRLFDAAGLARTQGEMRDSFACYGLKVLGEERAAYLMCHEDKRTMLQYYAVEVPDAEAARYFAMRWGFLPPAEPAPKCVAAPGGALPDSNAKT